ncbi:hypothetical protein NLJ89_g1854 [Agrocybe chaxingu]|uniref:Uncharacterized protein n=1 Tax=Agrocybe chaxingu TaxID=84603 RepID=A0A9W8MZ81_9AGAR|nr:hypothetical protein NLJ89_g1854 [Agrocybe chaxingu]
MSDPPPSFSSFPPSFSSFPDLEELAGPRQGESSSKHAHEKRKKKKGHSSSKEHRHKKDSDRKREKEQRKSKHAKDGDNRRKDEEQHEEFHRRDTGTSRDHFYSDRRGDPLNIQFGSLHAGDIPKYHIVGRSRHVLGLPASLVVHHRAGKGVEIGPSNYRKISSLADPGARTLLAKPPSRRILASSNTKYEEVDGFIRLPSGKRRAEDSYRSITRDDGNNSDSSSPSRDEDMDSSGEEGYAITLTAHQELLKSLEQVLTVNPQSIDKWVSLLDHTLSTIPVTSKNATKARSEISVSILSRALAADPQNAKNKILRFMYLKAGEETWHESKLRFEWEDALKVGGIEIQMEWLEWRIRKGNNGVDGVVESARRVLADLRAGEEGDIGKVRVFWRVATVIKNAGFAERAMAMFQAQAELTFHIPKKLSRMSLDAQLDELEEFWDSEVPRVGEDGASGWSSWHSSKESQQSTISKTIPEESTIPDLDPYREWAKQELPSCRTLRLPTRSDSDTLDPYSTILFSDIRPMLLNLTSERAKDAFRLAWLSVLGLHVPGFSLATSHELDWDDRWNLDYLTNVHYLNSIFPADTSRNKLTTDSVAGVVIGREREYSSPFGPVRCWTRGVSGPLDLTSAEPGKTSRRGLWTSDDVASVNEAVVRRIFAFLRLGQNDEEWHALALAFEAALSPKNAVKMSKSFLASNQTSLPLWRCHAQLEQLRGRPDEARKIYQTILVASKPNASQHEIGVLWWNWAEMEWLAGDDQQALNVVLKSVGMQGVTSGITVLRAKRALEDLAHSSRTETSWKAQEAWIKLTALLELLTGGQPETISATFDKFATINHEHAVQESLATSSLLMLYCYGFILKRPMPPVLLRERAHAAFEMYSNNSIILGLLLEAEKGQGVWGRMRALLGGNDGKAKDVARRIEEVWVAGWEKSRWLGEVERTRNGLATAVEHERTRSSPVIWRIYIEFEIRVNDLQRAKKLVFRAVGECPLAKDLYLLAFGPLRGVFTARELNGLADTMAERGLRLCQGLEEVVDTVEDGPRGDNEGSEDEIEYNAREYRRLLPY